MATAFCAGRTHDIKLFVRSRTALPSQTECLADSGYQGIAAHHGNSRTPKKKSKRHPLTQEQEGREQAVGTAADCGGTHHPQPEGVPHPR